MIDICVITPISHLEEYGNLGDIDMSLAHLICEPPNDEYAEYYKKQRKKGRFVILDNSAFEMEQKGKGLDPDPVLDAALITNPSEVIATDVLFDGPATVESTRKFIDRMYSRGLKIKKLDGPPRMAYAVMAVPQGKSIEEWMACYEELCKMPEVSTIGLSKLSIPMSWLGEKESDGNCARARLMCTAAIAEWMEKVLYGPPAYFAVGEVPVRPHHLLGGDNWLPWELRQQSKYSWIRSNDSSCAVWYGAHSHVFNEEGKISSILLEKPDLENHDHNTARRLSDKLGQTSILKNIVHWHKASKA